VRKSLSLVLLASFVAVSAAGAAHEAGADSVEQRLARARAKQAAARETASQAEAHLGRLLDAYRRLQAKLDQATKDVVAAYATQEDLSQRLVQAQERLNERVTAAYELGPAASIDLFLGSQSAADFASAQVYAASTFQVDDSSVSEVAMLKTALADSTARLEARKKDLARSVGRVQALAAAAAADAAGARGRAGAAGLEVKRLEKELEAARAAAAAALSEYLGSGGVGAGCASGTVHDLIVKSFRPLGRDQINTALAVATRESNCRPDAYNQTEVPPYGNASGVFQILTPGIWEPWSQRCGNGGASPFDPKANVAVAACVVADQGWWPWGF
jgi:peptidoglycan hydrolase CwlO-like protein